MLGQLLARHAYARFLRECRNPLRAQARNLRRILRASSHTDIGRACGFGQLARTRNDRELIRRYQNAVPVRSHGEMRAELDAVHAGHWQRLCPSQPIFFSMTAGSTGQFKYIPVTRESRAEVAHGSLVFQGAMERACPEVRELSLQFLVGSAEGGLSPAGVPQGFASGFNYRNLPAIVRSRFVLPYWVFTLEDADERAYAAGRILAGQRNLGALCAISPMNLINVHRVLERNAERLISDISNGTLSVRCASAIQGNYMAPPNHALASALATELRRTQRLPAELLFPSLRVLVCWQGGNMGYYLPELDARFGNLRKLEFPISASEAIFAIPDRIDRPGGVLAIDCQFLEFIPESAESRPQSITGSSASRGMVASLRADELEVGACYRIVVTTSGGLYRYDMEDVVRVCDYRERTPVIEFISKRDRQVSVSNERITERDVAHAMRCASEVCRTWFEEFLFVPCRDMRYRVLVDGSIRTGGTHASDQSKEFRSFAVELERQLRLAAKGYDFERDDALLQPLALNVTQPGALRRYLRERRGDPGLPSAQEKPMYLTNEMDAHLRFAVLEAYAA